MTVRRPWTDDECETLRLNYADWPVWLIAHLVDRSERAVYMQARLMGLSKSPGFYAGLFSGRLQRKDTRGGATRFKPGQTPANKGLRRPGWAPGRMASTQFKKGERQGVAVRLYQPIGTERISKDGYLERKVNDELPLQARWKAVHRIVWEAAHGPVPAGHAVAFLPGCRTTDGAAITADKLELISRAELMRRNTVHRLPPEVREVIQLTGALKRKIRNRSKAHA